MPHGSQMLSPRCNSRIVRITGRWDDAWFSTGLRILKNLKIRTQKLSDFACVFGILADSGNHGSRRTRAPIHFASNLRVLSRKPRGSSPKHLISRLGGFLCRFCVRIWPVLRAYFDKSSKISEMVQMPSYSSSSLLQYTQEPNSTNFRVPTLSPR